MIHMVEMPHQNHEHSKSFDPCAHSRGISAVTGDFLHLIPVGLCVIQFLNWRKTSMFSKIPDTRTDFKMGVFWEIITWS